jgi:hypothetical protein
LKELQLSLKNASHLKSIEKVIQGGKSEHLTWDLENFQICLISQTSNSKFIMIQASNEKVFNMKVVSPDLTIPKRPRSPHLAKVTKDLCMGAS